LRIRMMWCGHFFSSAYSRSQSSHRTHSAFRIFGPSMAPHSHAFWQILQVSHSDHRLMRKTVANEIERWFRAGAVDGFNLHVSRPRDFDRFLNEVVPILRERGLFRHDYEHDTLRGHLGLPVPENRYTVARELTDAIAAE